jgi:hypothetical protein
MSPICGAFHDSNLAFVLGRSDHLGNPAHRRCRHDAMLASNPADRFTRSQTAYYGTNPRHNNQMQNAVTGPGTAAFGPSEPFRHCPLARDYCAMLLRIRKPRPFASLVLAGFLGSLPLFGDTPAQHRSVYPSFRCYCQCENGGAMCATKICELPKYQKRSWAASCRKPRATQVQSAKPPESSPRARRSRAILHVQR